MRVFVAGGAGFIGSHTVERLLSEPRLEQVTVYDNFSSGRREHLPAAERRLAVIEGDLGDTAALTAALAGQDAVFHYASNPDIARAAREPEIDFTQGTCLTESLLEAMRRAGVRQILYASGSGVYGDAGDTLLEEDYAPLRPVSTYGASKLAGEALISAYCHMFEFRAWVFRFANVVGGRQTHGVGYDFLRRLREEPAVLRVLGDGTQTKPYIHISDLLDGIWLAWERAQEPYNCFNLATEDAVTVAEIAAAAIGALGLTGVRIEYSGGSRGWKGDVPVVRMDASRIKRLGWRARLGSRQAIERSLAQMLAQTEEPAGCRR
jgi:UDP-glucose 4-epimerase